MTYKGSKVIDHDYVGRRESNIRAYVGEPGRPAVRCVIRNVSEHGAFLEPVSSLIPGRIVRLAIEGLGLDLRCEVRHRGPRGFGVRFQNHAAAARLAEAVASCGTPLSACESR